MSNLNILIGSPCTTSYLMSVVMMALSVIILDIFAINMHGLDVDLWNGPRPNLKILIERPYTTSYCMAIAMLYYLSSFAR